MDDLVGGYVSARPDFSKHPAHSFEFRREPYVRVRVRVPLADGRGVVRDAKAVRWTDTHVLVHWETTVGAHNVWVTLDRVTRIKRAESSWQDSDDHADDDSDGA